VLSSVVLVIATAVAVSLTARALGMESHAASVLGAVLSPTDAAAVAGLAERVPRRALTVLRAESIINDGTALVLFAVTVSVAAGGPEISPPAGVGRFVGSYGRGNAVGLVVGGGGYGLAPPAGRAAGGRSPERADAVRGVLARPDDPLQRCRRGPGGRARARL